MTLMHTLTEIASGLDHLAKVPNNDGGAHDDVFTPETAFYMGSGTRTFVRRAARVFAVMADALDRMSITTSRVRMAITRQVPAIH